MPPEDKAGQQGQEGQQNQQGQEGQQNQQGQEGQQNQQGQEGQQNQQGQEGQQRPDWATLRTQYAKDNPALEKRLARYSSVEAALDALIAAQNKIAEGGAKAALPKDATAEQVAAWRVENGIPETPEGYDLSKLPNGRVIGDDDKPIVDEFTKLAHTQNLTPNQLQEVVGWYLADREAQIAALQEEDKVLGEKCNEALHAEWGPEYPLNKNLIKGLLATAPEGVSEQLLGARLADGTPLGSSPATLRWLATLARTINPTATIVPQNGDIGKTIANELANLQSLMGDHNSEYWKGPKAEAHQARYRELVDAKDKMASKA